LQRSFECSDSSSNATAFYGLAPAQLHYQTQLLLSLLTVLILLPLVLLLLLLLLLLFVVQEKRTRTVFQTANPLFDVHWSLPALSYDALLELELRDAANDRLLGVFDTTAFELLQRDADAVAAHSTPLPRYAHCNK
jgi:hypothetical protein